jgi:hypothetical protein
MIYIVSGLPRSGTSLAMQMLAAGGLEVLSDGLRAADADNPRGYYEWEQAKRLPQRPGLIAQAEGRAVKVISSLLFALPADHQYRVIFMNRPLEELLASQSAMIRRLGTQGTSLAAPAMLAALRNHLAQVNAWLGSRESDRLRVLKVQYHAVIDDPLGQAEAIAAFLEMPLDTAAMAREADRSLYRCRSGEQTPEGQPTR